MESLYVIGPAKARIDVEGIEMNRGRESKVGRWVMRRPPHVSDHLLNKVGQQDKRRSLTDLGALLRRALTVPLGHGGSSVVDLWVVLIWWGGGGGGDGVVVGGW